MLFLGAVYFFTMCAIGCWTAWHRRTAWGYWEGHTTIGAILLSSGGGLSAPVFFFREEVWWWGWAYVASAALTFTALSEFVITLNRRHRFATHGKPWFSGMPKTASRTGITLIAIAFTASGAWRNPWLLDPTVNPDEGFFVRMFWTAVATTMTYLLALIALRVLRLRTDPRRTDHKTLNTYLASCVAGIVLAAVAIMAAHGYGSTPTTLVLASLLLAGLSGGKVLTAGRSWRHKNAEMRKPPPAISTDYSRY
jgi:hypothetical protein